ncbi:MAG: DNA-methyltransferase [Promethearchaeota archaeon]
MRQTPSNTVDLLITSPPYPMIEMWDSTFSSLNEEIKYALEKENGKSAFNLMHKELDKIWKEVCRVIKPGGIVCINIGDATRTIKNNFQLFPNHIRIENFFINNGFIELPSILWRKPTNSPTKFMGSGMLPPNAYVTLEHEYILIFRKSALKRKIPPKSDTRYNSAYFWEERNKWFSDIWFDIRGMQQKLTEKENLRARSAAFPIEIPYRLINMFSIYGDTILDPFWGTGTTTLAAMISARNSIGYEINPDFMEIFKEKIKNIKELTDKINYKRLLEHIDFIKEYRESKKDIKYLSIYYKFPVITSQEIKILLYNIENIIKKNNIYILKHGKFKFKPKKRLIQSQLNF